jgi:hypothetical protein
MIFQKSLSSEHAGWAEGSCVTSRRFHEAVLLVIVSPPAGMAQAICNHGRSSDDVESSLPRRGCTMRYQKSQPIEAAT